MTAAAAAATTTTIRFILLIESLIHGLISVGYLFDIGPSKYDPTKLLIRGEPATLSSPGLELAFPFIIGAIYGSLSLVLLYVVFIDIIASKTTTTATTSIQTASLLCFIYHLYLLVECIVYDSVDGLINPTKVNKNDIPMIHAILGIPTLIVFILTLMKPPPTVASVTSNSWLYILGRMILFGLGVMHIIIFLGFGYNIGPFIWDPSIFLVRDEPMMTSPGMEFAFPIILSSYYCGLGICMMYAAAVGGSSVQVATIPSMVYHFGATHGHVFGDFHIINKKKAHPSQFLLLHGMLGILSMIAYFVIAVAMSPTKKKKNTNRTSNSRLKKTQ